jgi:tetratricopeptide (TPR) repeat protein
VWAWEAYQKEHWRGVAKLVGLNAGAIAEAQGDATTAQAAYQSALELKPAMADALYWQQNSLREAVLTSWRNSLPADNSALASGWKALGSNAPGQAIGWFQQAMAQDPNSLSAYQGLGQAHFDLNDYGAAQRDMQAGLDLPVTALEQTLGLHLLAGDVADARGDRAGAISEYATVFSGIADYDIDGPGSYGDPVRSRQVFHRDALPGELVPQLPRADITAAMDQRFAKLAQWYQAANQHDLACLVLERVHREVPESVSGRLYGQVCSVP